MSHPHLFVPCFPRVASWLSWLSRHASLCHTAMGGCPTRTRNTNGKQTTRSTRPTSAQPAGYLQTFPLLYWSTSRRLALPTLMLLPLAHAVVTVTVTVAVAVQLFIVSIVAINLSSLLLIIVVVLNVIPEPQNVSCYLQELHLSSVTPKLFCSLLTRLGDVAKRPDRQHCQLHSTFL